MCREFSVPSPEFQGRVVLFRVPRAFDGAVGADDDDDASLCCGSSCSEMRSGACSQFDDALLRAVSGVAAGTGALLSQFVVCGPSPTAFKLSQDWPIIESSPSAASTGLSANEGPLPALQNASQ